MPSIGVLVLVVTIVVCLVALALSYLRHRRGHGPRVLVRGLGVVAFLVGLYLSGLSDLVGNGIRSVYDWAHRTHMSSQMEVGFGLLVLGVVLCIVGTIIRPRTKDEARAARERRRASGSKAPAGRSMSAANQKAPIASSSGTDSSDEAEAVEILKNRGIE